MPFDRVVGAYLAEAKYESVRMLRAPAFAIPFLLIPLALYLFSALVLTGGTQSGTPNPNMMYFICTGFGVVGDGARALRLRDTRSPSNESRGP